ncbi:hypothetical protein FOZ62_004227 [Perkinsus olseni]|uniref:DNA polymerase kappa n=1 Tax=Perkinsus olseni TaxID=32597 RepID=A0A7J6NV70_PEROL|nr:hypothetical protein FOZ62_004227 [Perkinsus olseni]
MDPAEEATGVEGSSSSGEREKEAGKEEKDSMSHLYVFTAHKGGMDNVDKKLQLEVIEEMSKNSTHHAAALRRDKRVAERIETIKAAVVAMTKQDRAQRGVESDAIIASARKHCACDSDRWCCVVDMDMFYAAVEIRDDPSLNDVPLAVGGDSMISTANYVARKYGVRAAMPGFIARELCRRQGVELRFKAVDMPRYQAASDLFKEAVLPYGPMKMLSLDEVPPVVDVGAESSSAQAYIDITARVREAATVADDNTMTQVDAEEAAASQLVSRMREEVRERTGGLTCSAGIAKGCFRLAKMGSDIKKPNGQFMVPTTREEMLRWLQDLPIRKLHGVGRVSERELSAGLGIEKVGDVIKKAAELLHTMSSNGGHWLINAAMGVADTEDIIGATESGPKSISQERSLSTTESGSPAYLHEVLQELCTKVMELCQEKGQYGRCVTLKLKTFEWDVKQKSNTLKREVRSERLLYETASELMGAAMTAASIKKPVRLLGVRVSAFHTAPQGQSTLGEFLAAHQSSSSSSKALMEECVAVEKSGGDERRENACWNCKVCTFLNKTTARICAMCGTARRSNLITHERACSRSTKRAMVDDGQRPRKVHKGGGIERYMIRGSGARDKEAGIIDLTDD